MSLTTCLKKVGSALDPADKAAIIARARELRGQGMGADEAAVKAARDLLAELRAEAKALEPAKPAAPKPTHPKTVMGSEVLAIVSARLGGLDPAWLGEFSVRAETGRKGKDGRPVIQWRNPLIPGVGKLFRRGGTQDLQAIAEQLEEAGFLEAGSVERDAKAAGEAAKDMIRAALERKTVERVDDRIADLQAQQEAEAQAYYAELDAEAAREADAERAAIMAEAEMRGPELAAQDDEDLFDMAGGTTDTAAAMRAMGFTEQEIADELARQGQAAQAGPAEDAAPAGEAAAAPGQAGTAAPRAEPERAAQEGLTPQAAEAQRLIGAHRAEFGKVPSGMSREQWRDFHDRRRAAEAALDQRLLELAAQGDGLLLPMRDSRSFVSLHRDPRKEDGWRTTNFTADMEPSGHMEFDRPEQAAADFRTRADPGAAPLLTAQTPEDLKAKAEREATARKADDAEQKRLADKAKADAERDEFVLTGSDRPADVAAAAGQGGLFDGPSATTDAQPAAPTPRGADNTIFTLSDAEKAREVLRKKLRQLNSGIDPEMMQAGITLAGYHIEAGARSFAKFARAMVDDLGEMVKPYLKSWYAAVSFDPRSQAFAAEMTPVAELATIDLDTIDQEAGDAAGSDAVLERDRRDGPGEAGAVGDAVQAAGRGTEPGAGEAGRGAGEGRRGRADDPGLSAGGALAPGERGGQRLHRADGADAPAEFDAGTAGPDRSGDAGVAGVPPQRTPATAAAQAAGGGVPQAGRAERQRAADRIPVKVADAENIRQTLPLLLLGQQEDVGKAEARFSKPEGYGMLFTNGTGTGKTYLGGGVVKRMVRQGKGNILIVAPDAKIIEAWIEALADLGVSATRLKDTKDAGKGVVLTTYANLGDNDAVATRAWDMVLADEAQDLLQNKDGEPTKHLEVLRAITMHPRGMFTRYQMLNRDDIAALKQISDQITANVKIMNNDDTMDAMVVALRDENEKLQAKADKLSAKLEEARKKVKAEVEASQGDKRTRMLALSATPFAYEKTTDWAEGYLFDYKDGYPYDETSTRYNQPSPREYFMMTRFGWRMRVGKLTEPDAKVDRGLLQRQFNGWLKKQGVLSARALDVAADYDRRFVLVDSAVGNRIDEALKWLSDKSAAEGEANRKLGRDEQANGFGALNGAVSDRLYGSDGHLVRRYLLEAIKAKEVIAHIKEHMALGRKVVVFHDFKKGGSVNPFAIGRSGGEQSDVAGEAKKARDFNAALDAFNAAFPDLTGSGLLSDLIAPVDRFRRELPGVLIVNGDQKERDNLAAYRTFNDDASGPQVMLVQSAKNKGWSGHDTTGKHQRVLFNLGLPTQPTTSIQQEGRIYRTGQVTDAVMRYLNTGTNWERWAFAQTIAQRASTAENLAMGEGARALRDAFINGFEESGDYRAGHEGEGKGGKERDRIIDTAVTEYDRAKSAYWGTQKKNARTKAEEGKDYFATPEPLGQKMVEWADLRPGESSLEPSAGHGAIARWTPDSVQRTAIEPSMALRSRLALVFDGDIKAQTFEDLHIVNKFDGVQMNPPFGTAGRQAIDHLAKATTHLRDGGRVVALIPTGPSADAKFDKWFDEVDDKGRRVHADLHLVAEILLPRVTFERAGATPPTRVVVIERTATPPQFVRRDLSNAEDINEFFNRLENVEVPRRAKPVAQEVPTATDRRQEQAAQKEEAKAEGAKIADNMGLETTEHITGKGKKLQGVIRRDLSYAQAKAIDEYTFKKDGGWFIRVEHLPRMMKLNPPPGSVAAEERAVYAVNEPAGTDVPLDLFPESLEGLQALPAGPGRTRAGQQRRAAAGGDVQPPAPVPNTLAEREDPTFPGVYHYSTQLVEVGRRDLPVARVTNWREAASALGALRRYAVEHFDALVTDAKGKPLAVIGSFKGAQTQASVYPSTLLAEALRIKGAARVWGVHNHPSGTPDLSAADERLSAEVARIFGPSDVEWMGIAAVGGDRYSAFDGVVRDGGNTIGGPAVASIPVVERTIERGNVGLPTVDSPDRAKGLVQKLSVDQPGIVFFDAQNRLTAWVPVQPSQMGKLRESGRFDRLINSATRAGAGAAIIANPNGAFDQRALNNIASALKLADIRTLDAIDPITRTSAAERGVEPNGNMPVLSRIPQTETPEFRDWFEDSKVVDADGKPLVLYHGTGADNISVFNSPLVWASADPTHASGYAEAAGDLRNGKANVLPVYAKITAPFDADADSDKGYMRIADLVNSAIRQAAAQGRPVSKADAMHYRRSMQEAWNRYGLDDSLVDTHHHWSMVGRMGTLNLRDMLQGMGFDGIKYTEDSFMDGKGISATTYAVFSPRQIKSAIGNRGTFDPNEADIRASRAQPQRRGIDFKALQPHIDGITAKLAGLRNKVEVVPTAMALPGDIVQSLWSMGAMHDVRGLRMPDGRVYLIADALEDTATAEFVLFHELFGHEGLRALLTGDEYARVLTKLRLANPKLAAEADAWMSVYGQGQINARVERGMSEAEARRVVRLLAVEEALSDRAGDNEPPKLWKDVAAAIIRALRRVGADKLADWLEARTEAETYALLMQARRVITEGQQHVMTEGLPATSNTAPVWYSALLREVGAAPMNQGTAAAWNQYLDALAKKGAVKADEIEWTGLREWLALQPGKVTKAAVGEYLAGNGVMVQEVVLGTALDDTIQQLRERRNAVEQELDALGFEMRMEYGEAILHKRVNGMDFVWEDGEFLDEDGDPLADTDAAARDLAMEYGRLTDRIEQWNDTPTDDGRAKYAQYTLPGGTNYREVLLTLPVGTKPAWVDRAGNVRSWIDAEPSAEVTRAMEASGLRRQNMPLTDAASVYKSGHWDQPNILAHIRLNDRTDADGKRVLFVEELQSDWSAAGRKQGFGREPYTIKQITLADLRPEERGAFPNLRGAADDTPIFEARSERDGRRLYVSTDRAAVERQAEARSGNGVPRAPFIDTTDKWVSLALKRIIHMAATEGYDRVAFVTGEQSAERYDLSKQIGKLRYGKNPSDGTYNIRAYRLNSEGIVLDEKRVTLGRIEDLVGKEIAKKIEAGEGDGRAAIMRESNGDHDRELSGLDLKVGGEGMRAFYDKIVPAVMKDVLRKVGGGQMTTTRIAAAGAFDKFIGFEGGREVWRFDTREAARRWAEAAEGRNFVPADGERLTQPAFDITPAMREKAAGGMPLFSRREPPAAMAPAVAITRDETGTPTEIVGPGVVLAYPQPTERMEVIPGEGQQVLSYAIMPTQGFDSLGFVELLVDNGRPVSLLDIEVTPYGRRRGTGRAVIETLLAAEPGADLNISNIVENARGFWSRMGVPEQNRAPGEAYDGTLNWQAFAEAQAANPRGTRGMGAAFARGLGEPDGRGQGADRRGAGNPARDGGGQADFPALSRKPAEPGWAMPAGTRFDNFVYKFQDKLVDLKRAVQSIKAEANNLPDTIDAYLQEELFHGRAAKRTQDFVRDELEPLLKDMVLRGVKIDDLDLFLHARHAEEANKLIAERNKRPDEGQMDTDGKVIESPLQDGGSGMLTADAKAYLAGLEPARRKALDALAARVDAIIAKTRDTYVAYGLESKATVDGWAAMFKHYVPLMREDHDGGMGVGQGFSIKGREAKHRTGSTAKVVDILANIALQRERAIVRGEKNRVAVALAGLVKANPAPEFWQLDKIPTQRVLNEADNTVREQQVPGWKSNPNVLVAKVRDKEGNVHERAIVFNERNPRAMRMVESLKNLDAAQLEGVLGVSAKITRYFASINTQYNPIFGVVNLARDVQGAAINLTSTELKDKRAEVLKNIPAALRAIYRDERGKSASPLLFTKANEEMTPLWEELQKEGGMTGFRDLFKTSEDRAAAIEFAMNPTAWMDGTLGKFFTAGGTLKVPLAVAQKGATKVFDWLSDYNQSMEGAVRLAAYKVALEQGMSKQRAASIAKNITVNFNRKGQVGQQAGALYAFFNASVQGTARMGEVIFNRPPGQGLKLTSAGVKIIGGGIFLGALQAWALALAGFDDEDEPPQFVRERNLIIPTGWVTGKKDYITVPMPLGWHVFPNIGRITTEFAMGGFEKAGKRVADFVAIIADAFNPMGNAGLSLQTVMPTPIDPLVALAENRDWTGKPIARKTFNEATPGFKNAKDTASEPAKWLAEAINWATGGTEHKAGAFSPTPDQIDYLIGQVTGGVGREISKINQTGTAIYTGEDLPPHKIPLLGRFYGNVEASSAQGSRFYNAMREMNLHEAQVKGLSRDIERANNQSDADTGAELQRQLNEYQAKHPEASDEWIKEANRIERAVQKLRREKREMVATGAPRADVKAKEEEITATMRDFNESLKALRQEAKEAAALAE